LAAAALSCRVRILDLALRQQTMAAPDSKRARPARSWAVMGLCGSAAVFTAPHRLAAAAGGELAVPSSRWQRCLPDGPVGKAPWSVGGRSEVGCNARENGVLRYRLLRPGAYPGLAGRYRRPLVFRTFRFDAFCRPRS
jgi:hypothetical protein